jgi:hypothetical protein
MKSGPREKSGCKQKALKHTAGKAYDYTSVVTRLQANVLELTHRVKSIQLENEKLSHRQRALTGMWLASREAVKLVQSSIHWGSMADVTRALASMQDLETTLLQSVETDRDWVDPLQQWTAPLQTAAGTASELFISFLDPDKMYGPLEHSILGGIPCGLPVAILLCLCCDPLFIQQLLKTAEEGPEAVAAATAEDHAESIRALKPFLERTVGVKPETPNSCQMLNSIAMLIMRMCRGMVSGAVLFQTSGLQQTLLVKGLELFPPDAKVDEVASKVALTEEQVLSILKEQSVFTEILAPLGKEKAELLASISQALAAKDLQQAAAAAEGGSGSGGGSSTDTSKSASSATAATIDDLLFSEISHLELLQKMSRLVVIQQQLWWLELCCCSACYGKLTWWQLGTVMASFEPYPPLPGLLIRRLVTRTSIMLLLPGVPYPRGEGPYLRGTDALSWYMAGVPIQTGNGVAVAEQEKEAQAAMNERQG